ncbi:MAG: N-succinylarginine dihydrolase [Deltaproteobacteria bacterium]|nr:N-succinylarginine dihydrolase [Deltaproteobacteria bacterium]
MFEYNFDGLVGPTHNYAGLAPGNFASTVNQGQVSNPREAALQGLAKMRFVHSLGGGQALLPPHERPSLHTLRTLGFSGSDEVVIARAAREWPQALKMTSSAAAMWTANAATVAPSSDTRDARVHFSPANLQSMFHRSLESATTHRVLQAIFADTTKFVVHPPLPSGELLSDEGAANHLRLIAYDHHSAATHVFAWGRSSDSGFVGPKLHPARQSREASESIARRHLLDPARTLFVQQSPDGIDGGAFHTDVLAVASMNYLLMHESAFVDPHAALSALASQVGESFSSTVVTAYELSLDDAVASYVFNSQIVQRRDNTLALIAPRDSDEIPAARAVLDRIVAGRNPVTEVHCLDLRQSMHNGGGPACLRLRVSLTDAERDAIRPSVFYSESLAAQLERWVRTRYRDRLTPSDLIDPTLARESMLALDELTQILGIGSVYDFQR